MNYWLSIPCNDVCKLLFSRYTLAHCWLFGCLHRKCDLVLILSKLCLRVLCTMRFLSISLLCLACSCRLICSRIIVIGWTLVLQVISSSDAVMSISLSMSVAFLSHCDVLWLASACLYILCERFSSSSSCPYSWTRISVAWLYSSAWHSAGDIGQLGTLLTVEGSSLAHRSLVSLIGRWVSMSVHRSFFHIMHEVIKEEIQKARPLNTMTRRRERTEVSERIEAPVGPTLEVLFGLEG